LFSIRAIWIGKAKRRKRFYLNLFHMSGLSIIDMVIAKQVQRAMDNQVRYMIG
jgi:hypothetical protein